MNASFFLTITTGVSVLVTGQILIKCILDPYISFKEHLGLVSALLLREQNKILNLSAKSEVVQEIKYVSALLQSKSHAVPLYGVFASLRLLPQYKNVREASRNLNLIASTIEGASNISPPSEYTQVHKSLTEIGKDLKVMVSYK